MVVYFFPGRRLNAKLVLIQIFRFIAKINKIMKRFKSLWLQCNSKYWNNIEKLNMNIDKPYASSVESIQ